MYVPVVAGLLIRLRNSAINEPFRCFFSAEAMIGAVSYKSIYVYIIMCMYIHVCIHLWFSIHKNLVKTLVNNLK
jgi:hypothetical protein